MPIRQFFYFDAIECLPENVFQAATEAQTTDAKHIPQLTTKTSRYFGQELVFGQEFQQKLLKSKYFVVRELSPSHRMNYESTRRFFSFRSGRVQSVVKC